MPLLRSDFDQSIRYLKSAKEILERVGMNGMGLRNALDLVITRLSPDQATLIAELPAGHITVMRGLAQKARELNQLDAATEILKAVAVLRDTTR